MLLEELSGEALLQSTVILAHDERRIGVEVLRYLREIERRRLYAELAYPSLFDFVVDRLGYSEGSAGRRVAAMRLMRDIPEVESALEDGSLGLTVASMLHHIFRREKGLSNERKLSLIAAVRGRSQREAEKILAGEFPRANAFETIKPLTGELTEIRLILDDQALEKVRRAKDVLSHKIQNGTYSELIEVMAEMILLKHEKRKKSTPSVESKTGEQSKSRYVPAADRDFVLNRDNRQCTYVGPDGKRCTATCLLQFDHVEPFSLGGSTTWQNLRLLCRTHNLLVAQKKGLLKTRPQSSVTKGVVQSAC